MTTAAGRNSGLLFLCDAITKHQFLVDTRAEVSIPPTLRLDRRTWQTGPQLQAANSSSIRMYGAYTLSLHFASNTYWWNFVIANVSCPLLGADFLHLTPSWFETNGWWMQQLFTLFHIAHPQSLHPILAAFPAPLTSKTYCSWSFQTSQVPISFGLAQSMV